MHLLTGVGGNNSKLTEEPWFLICAAYHVLDEQIMSHNQLVRDLINQKFQEKKEKVNNITQRLSQKLNVEL